VAARDERLAGNEALVREVNERVSEVAEHFVEVERQTEKVDFICECGRGDCTEPITMTLAEYEAIRAEPTHFGVVPHHEQPEIEAAGRGKPGHLGFSERGERRGR
jgi:hypothetical protein